MIERSWSKNSHHWKGFPRDISNMEDTNCFLYEHCLFSMKLATEISCNSIESNLSWNHRHATPFCNFQRLINKIALITLEWRIQVDISTFYISYFRIWCGSLIIYLVLCSGISISYNVISYFHSDSWVWWCTFLQMYTQHFKSYGAFTIINEGIYPKVQYFAR